MHALVKNVHIAKKNTKISNPIIVGIVKKLIVLNVMKKYKENSISVENVILAKNQKNVLDATLNFAESSKHVSIALKNQSNSDNH